MPTDPKPPNALARAQPILVVVLDDEAVVRDALVGLLLKSEGFAVGALAGQPYDLLRDLAPATDVVLIGLHLDLPDRGWPGGELAFLVAVRQRSPEARLLVLSNPIELSDVEASRRGGAAGHLSKGAPPWSCWRPCEPWSGARRSSRPVRRGAQGRRWPPSPRESGRCWATSPRGATTSRSRTCSTSQSTVKAHVAALYRKLGVDNRVELILLGRRAR